MSLRIKLTTFWAKKTANYAFYKQKFRFLSSPYLRYSIGLSAGFITVVHVDNSFLLMYECNKVKFIEVLLPTDAQENCFKRGIKIYINPLKPELNPICYLLALLGVHYFLCVSRIRVKSLTFRLLMSYIYGAPILDVSRSHTTTQHSR